VLTLELIGVRGRRLRREARPRTGSATGRGVTTSLWLIAPAAALFAFVWVVPIVRAISLSTQQTLGATTVDVGLRNFSDLPSDSLARSAFLNAAEFIALIGIPMTCLSLAVAVLLQSAGHRARSVVGTILLLPFVTSPVIAALIFRTIYADGGGLDGALHALHLPNVQFLDNPVWAKLSLTGMVLWQLLGFNTMLMLAGLQRIPRDLFEAARMDGASGWRTALRVTVPLMWPIILFVSVTTCFGVINLFAEPDLLTGGGPGTATLTPGLQIYSDAFRFGHFGSAAALGLVTAAFAAAFGIAQLRLQRRWV
jgi:ABC-type sugar transport system permease subunit